MTMGDNDLDWPTFDGDDTRVSYSPDAEKELMFDSFIPKTEDPKSKKMKKKKPALRLVSESDLEEERLKREARRRRIIIATIVLVLFIIVTISVILGVYFGVIAKEDSPGGPISSASNGSEIIVTVLPLTSSLRPSATSSTVIATKPVTKSPTSAKTTTKSTTPTTTTTTTTTSTTTTTTTTSTTTTTTTTTTPAPTEPPVIPYTDNDLPVVVEKARLCAERISTTVVSTLTKDEKCRLYRSMLLCTYTSLIQEKILCGVDTLTEIAATNIRKILPFWLSIEPLQCKEADGSFNAGNITVLPVTTDELCYSPDAVQYLWRYGCHVTYTVSQYKRESEETKCLLYFSIIGCISQNLTCAYEDIESIVKTYYDDLDHQLDLNLTACTGLYNELNETDICQLQLYRNMETISANCSKVLFTDNPAIKANIALQCGLVVEFSRCVVKQAYDNEEISYCKNVISGKLLHAAANFTTIVNAYLTSLSGMHQCEYWMPDDVRICTDSIRIVNIVEALCYRNVAYGNDPCRDLYNYIYVCGADALTTIGESQCFPEQIRDAFLSDQVLQERYNIDFRSKVNKDCKDKFS